VHPTLAIKPARGRLARALSKPWSRPRSPTGRRPPSTCGFSTVNLPCAASIIKAKFTFAFSSSHFTLRPRLCSRRVPLPLRHWREPPVSTTFPSPSLPRPRAAAAARSELTSQRRPRALASRSSPLHRAFTLCNDLSLRASSPRCLLCCQPSSPRSSCSMHQGGRPLLQRSQAGRLCVATPCATSARQVFDEVVERDVISCYSITGVYMFSWENHGAGLVSLASQLGLSCYRACSLALLLCLALPPAARCAAFLHYSAACCACCCCRWLCCRSHFDCWMLVLFCSGSTTP
jgi:hypothetical protein